MTTWFCFNILPPTSSDCSRLHKLCNHKKNLTRAVPRSSRLPLPSTINNAKTLICNVEEKYIKEESSWNVFPHVPHQVSIIATCSSHFSHYETNHIGLPCNRKNKKTYTQYKNLWMHGGFKKMYATFSRDNESNNNMKYIFSSKKVIAFRTFKHLLAGVISAIISRTLVAPLERLKLEYILHGTTDSMFITVCKIFYNEGYSGFWRGNILNLLRTAPYKSVNFFAYDMYQKQWLACTGAKETTNFEKVVAGAAAGVTATLICFPLDTIRIRLIAPGGEGLGGLMECTISMVQKGGLSSLYVGLLPALISMAPSGAIFYGIFGLLKSSHIKSPKGEKEYGDRLRKAEARGSYSNSIRKLELGPYRTLLYGAIAGVCAETFTYPFEVIRRQLQLQKIASRFSLIEIFRILVNKGGVRALYVGLLPSTFQVFPTAALSFFLYEVIKSIFGVE